MDIELLKTFLEVSRTRHFGKAAENLFVTQSAVSARIKLLEQTVGIPLFYRARNNIQLTAAGQKLLRDAEGIVNLWNRARQQVLVRDEIETFLSISGVPSLWDIFLQDWLEGLCRVKTNMMFQADVQGGDAQLRMLRDGTLDLAFMFDNPNDSNLISHEVTRVPLILVSAKRDTVIEQAMRDGYILVDWGTSFAISHAQYFPDMPPPVLRVGLGRIALSMLLNVGGAAYVAEPTVRDHLDAGDLFQVKDAPTIERAAFATYARHNDRLQIIESILHEVLPESGDRLRP